MAKVMVYIIHDRSIDEEVMDIFGGLEIEHYTKFRDVPGVGSNGPHLGDHVWPALNNVTMTVIEEQGLDTLLERIQALRSEFPFVGLRAVAVPVLAMI